MATYPSAIYSPVTKTNKAGVVYDAAKTTVVFAEDFNTPHAEIVAIETELGTLPKGSDADVKTRLNRIDAGNITIDNTPNTDHTAEGPKTNLTAGASLVFGDVCYMGSDGKMEKGDADAVATAFCWVIALATIAEDSAGSFALPGCFVRDDSWNWTSIGQPVYLDTATAGGLTQTAPSGADDVIQIIGIAVTADVIFFYPQLVQVEHI
jgi:hypothetical protein